MSLYADSIFYQALVADSDIASETGGRIYSTAIPVPDEDLDNEPLPYIVITFDGLTNDETTKDEDYESGYDQVQIGIIVAHTDRDSLAALIQKVRDAVKTFFTDYTGDDEELVPLDYNFKAGPVGYDPFKPCYSQELTYDCTTNA